MLQSGPRKAIKVCSLNFPGAGGNKEDVIRITARYIDAKVKGSVRRQSGIAIVISRHVSPFELDSCVKIKIDEDTTFIGVK